MSGRCAAASGAGALVRATPPACSEPGSEVSLGDFLRYLVVHRQVGYRPAQSGVLLFKFLQTPALINLVSRIPCATGNKSCPGSPTASTLPVASCPGIQVNVVVVEFTSGIGSHPRGDAGNLAEGRYM